MDFDTTFWDEIQDSPGEIFDELFEEEDNESSFHQFLKSNVTL